MPCREPVCCVRAVLLRRDVLPCRFGVLWVVPCVGAVCSGMYRADWEPAAASGKCTAGVPGVLWRSPAVLWGPPTPNPMLVAGRTHTSENWPIFHLCMWRCGESAPCGQARLWRPNGPQYAKAMPFGSLPHQGLKNYFFKKYFSFFGPFRAHWGAFCGFRAVGHISQLAYYLGPHQEG